jgi:3-oxoacyl-[acyl-carrier-protein] synthase-3
MNIIDVSYALPKKEISTEDITSWVDIDKDFLQKQIGVKKRYFLDDNESGVSLALSATKKLLKKNNLEVNKISLIIYVTQTPDYLIPHNSAILHKLLNGDKNTMCFDVGLGCSGYPHALEIAKALLKNSNNYGLIVTCDPYSKIIDKKDKNTVSLFGDGASATLLGKSGFAKIGKSIFGTNGLGNDALIIKSGHAAYPIASYNKKTPCLDMPLNEYRLKMNGRKVFNMVMSEIPLSIFETLKINKLKLDDIDYFAFHQGSEYMLNNLVSKVKIDNKKVLKNLTYIGNTVSSSIPILLSDFFKHNNNFKGNILVSGFGVGFSWGTSILKVNKFKE